MADWQPIETAPFQETIWVRNNVMKRPVKATRGYVYNGAVHGDLTFCTLVHDPDTLTPLPPGTLVCATEWAAVPDNAA